MRSGYPAEYIWPDQPTETGLRSFDTYWMDLVEAADQADNPDFIKTAQHSQRHLQRLTDTILEADPHSSNPLMMEVEAWWDACGTLNPMKGAEPVLALASDYYLRDLEHIEHPTKNQMLLAGELLFQRALLDRTSLGVDDGLFQAAQHCFDQVKPVDDPESLGKQRVIHGDFRAFMFQFDVRFEQLQQQYYAGEIDSGELQTHYRELLHSFTESSGHILRGWFGHLSRLDDVKEELRGKKGKRAKQSRKSIKNKYAGRLEWAGGKACELISVMMLRYNAMRNDEEHLVSARSSFMREEDQEFYYPGDKKVKIHELGGRHGIDVVHERFDLGYPGMEVEHMQVKIADYANTTYLAPITMVDGFRGLFSEQKPRSAERGRQADDEFDTLGVLNGIDSVLQFIGKELSPSQPAPNEPVEIDRVDAVVSHLGRAATLV